MKEIRKKILIAASVIFLSGILSAGKIYGADTLSKYE